MAVDCDATGDEKVVEDVCFGADVALVSLYPSLYS